MKQPKIIARGAAAIKAARGGANLFVLSQQHGWLRVAEGDKEDDIARALRMKEPESLVYGSDETPPPF